MSYDREKCERLMKVCQRGYPPSAIGAEYANNTLAECYGVIGALMLEIDQLQKDAERYRWLRSPAVGPHIISTHLFETVSDDCNPPYRTMKIDKELDEAIDLRMKDLAK